MTDESVTDALTDDAVTPDDSGAAAPADFAVLPVVEPVPIEAFKDAMAELAAGVTLLTVHLPAERLDLGMIITSLASASLQPPKVLAAIGRYTSLAPYLAPGARVGLSILAQHQHDLAADFSRRGRPTADEIFKERPHHRGAVTGALLSDDALAQIEGVVEQNLAAGDHSLVVVGVRAATVPLTEVPTAQRQALTYHRRGYTRTDCPE